MSLPSPASPPTPHQLCSPRPSTFPVYHLPVFFLFFFARLSQHTNDVMRGSGHNLNIFREAF